MTVLILLATLLPTLLFLNSLEVNAWVKLLITLAYVFLFTVAIVMEEEMRDNIKHLTRVIRDMKNKENDDGSNH